MNETDLKRAEADAIGLTLEELLDLEQNQQDEEAAKELCIESWEVRMRRLGSTDAEIELHRQRLNREMHEIID